MQKPGFIRAIDVEDFCTKEILDPARCRYVALSYVWGGASTVKLTQDNMFNLMSKDGLRQYMHKLPQTVVDAIEVVRRLGERYLWTDAFLFLFSHPNSFNKVTLTRSAFREAEHLTDRLLISIDPKPNAAETASFKTAHRKRRSKSAVWTACMGARSPLLWLLKAAMRTLD
jgi:hypothetical protein